MTEVTCTIRNYNGDLLRRYVLDWDEAWSGLLDSPVAVEPGESIGFRRNGETIHIVEMYEDPIEGCVLGFREA